MDGKFIFVHSELFDHFHEGVYRKGVVLHGDAEFLFRTLLGDVFGFDQLILLHHLTGVAQELLALGGYGNSTVCPAEKLYPDFLFQFPDCGR